MEVSDFKPSGPAKLELVDFRGQPTGVFFELLSQDEPEVIRAQRDFAKRHKGNLHELLYEQTTEALAAATVSWNLTENGKELECNRENARKLYREVAFIREQVLSFSNDRANFAGN